jgi:hypothetical protein
MTRIDLTTREWHELVKPVLPHMLSSDADQPELAVIRLEVTDLAAFAVATDRYTLAAERHQLAEAGEYGPAAVCLHGSDVTASLKLFAYSKDYDPPLRVTIDAVPFPVTVAGIRSEVRRLAVTIESPGVSRLVLHDHRDPTRDPLAGWRKMLGSALARPALPAPALYLNAAQLGRWAAACRKGERLGMFTGEKGDDLILVTAEKHFLGAWRPMSYLDEPAAALGESPWLTELNGDAP